LCVIIGIGGVKEYGKQAFFVFNTYGNLTVFRKTIKTMLLLWSKTSGREQ
jgi:hypothetical protein